MRVFTVASGMPSTSAISWRFTTRTRKRKTRVCARAKRRSNDFASPAAMAFSRARSSACDCMASPPLAKPWTPCPAKRFTGAGGMLRKDARSGAKRTGGDGPFTFVSVQCRSAAAARAILISTSYINVLPQAWVVYEPVFEPGICFSATKGDEAFGPTDSGRRRPAMMNTLRALIALAGMMFAASIATYAQAIEPHGNIGMPAPVIPAPGQNGAPRGGKIYPEPELSITKDGRAECVDWDRWSPQPSVRCFYTITVKNNGSAPYWGPISVEDKPTGTGPEGTRLNYQLSGWGSDRIWRRCLSTDTPGTGDIYPHGPFFCETNGGATGTDGLAPGEEITLTIEVVVERQPEDFLFENCADICWDWMRHPIDSDEAVLSRLAELGYWPAGSRPSEAGGAITAFQRDRGLSATGAATTLRSRRYSRRAGGPSM